MNNQVVIVGAGPAGAVLALLFARRGIAVTLVERHADFSREFRGEGLQPSGVSVLTQMGLADELARLPHLRAHHIELFLDGRQQSRLSYAELGADAPTLVSQPPLLEMLVAHAAQSPSFTLLRGATVRDLLRDEHGRIAGVRVRVGDDERELRAALVIGTDGRSSVVRARAEISVEATPQVFDVLWMKAPAPPFVPPGAARLEVRRGHKITCMVAADGQLQIGWILPKGGFGALKKLGESGWFDELCGLATPELRAHLEAHRAKLSAHPTVLDVRCDLVSRWTAPGVLLLGDAAHPMSPIGGQGINMALRDAAVAANHLCPLLLDGAGPEALDAAARAIEAERLPEVKAAQELQTQQARDFLEPDKLSTRIGLRMVGVLAKLGLLRATVGRRFQRLAHGYTTVKLAV
jgi:2-polyprenyl-6-methoxyphenol hydroxylase-like FAD-dependent oxidoreductase